jgi:hypothetical protein
MSTQKIPEKILSITLFMVGLLSKTKIVSKNRFGFSSISQNFIVSLFICHESYTNPHQLLIHINMQNTLHNYNHLN